MSDANETSYYEIALTHRQVVVSFVVLLVFVLAVFLCGVWVGRNGQPGGAPQLPQVAQSQVGPDDLANMQELEFFSGEGEGARQQPEELSELLDEPRADTTLAQDVGSSAGAPPPSAPQEIPPRAGQAPGAEPRSAPPPPAREPAPSTGDSATSGSSTTPPPVNAPIEPPRPAAVTPAPPPGSAEESFVIQVFVSRDEAQARKVRQQLVDDGLQAYLSPVDVGGQTMHRVRIGPFDRRDRAEAVARNVKTKFRLDTWVTAASN